MTALDLLATLNRAGVVLSAKGDRLAYDAPKGAMTADLLATIKARKAEVLAVLAGNWCAAASALLAQVQDAEARADLLYLFDERAGICQYDGNMSRGEAERQAYRELARAVEGGGR